VGRSPARNRSAKTGFLLLIALTAPSGADPGFREIVSWQRADARLYSVVASDLDGDGTDELVVGGQLLRDKGWAGYLAVLKQEGERLVVRSEQAFLVEHDGGEMPARVRTVRVGRSRADGQLAAYAVGRGGRDEEGVGFLHRSAITEGVLTSGATRALRVDGEPFTHGYAMELADLDGDGRIEILSAGFCGDETRQSADVRVFEERGDGRLEERDDGPFAELAVPIRVNAMAVGDLDGEGREEVVIGGRTGEGSSARGALAAWSGGRTRYAILGDGRASRFRALLIEDLDGDGREELLAGGRIEAGSETEGWLGLWRLGDDGLALGSRYVWTGDGSTRLRALTALSGRGSLVMAGRSEVREGVASRWLGFVRAVCLADVGLVPCGGAVHLDKGWETRIRAATMTASDRLVAVGFAEDREGASTAFLSVLAP
jgi:hypothetical protein